MSADENGNGKRLYYGYCEYDETAHKGLLTIATMEGKSIKMMIGIAVEELIVNYNRRVAGNDPELALAALALESRARQRKMEMVKEIAYRHLENPDEESADRLESACKLAGVSLEFVLEEVTSKPKVVSVVMGDSTVLKAVEKWLREVFKEHDVLIAAKDVKAEGAKRGFEQYALNDVKRRMGIVSKKEGKNWYWFLPGDNPKPESNGNGKEQSEPAF